MKASTIIRQLNNIASAVENRMPAWTIVDKKTCRLMRAAAKKLTKLKRVDE
jgi:hypothetical protein